VGGCTNVYNNAVVLFDLGTEDWEIAWPYDNSAPTSQPGCGCNRGVCYDPHTKNVWTVGGATSGCGGKYGLWKGDMAGRTWTSVLDRQGKQAHITADSDAKKIIFYYWDIGSFKHCKIYDPATNNATEVPPMPGTTEVEWVYYPHHYWYALEYMPAMNGTMTVGCYQVDTARGYMKEEWYTWLLNTQTGTWTDLKATGLPDAYGRATLSYDPMGRVMLLLIMDQGLYEYNQNTNQWSKITTSNDPTGGWSEMFEYDSEHNVHVFTMLSGKHQVWAFRYANDPTPGEIIGRSIRLAPVLSCFPNPFRDATFIKFSSKFKVQGSKFKVQIFNSNGKMVKDLSSIYLLPSTFYLQAEGLSPGVYLIRAITGKNIFSKKVMLIR
jgi:hypothetical protein